MDDIRISDDEEESKPQPSPSAPPKPESQSQVEESNGKKAEPEEEDPSAIYKDGSIQVFKGLSLKTNVNLQVFIKAYEKRGEGINAYLVYKIETRVHNIPGYTKSMSEVWRRFSDFLGLRDKLIERYQVIFLSKFI